MPLDGRATTITESLNSAFADIGLVGDTAMPRARGKLEPLAWEYWAASLLLRLAEARRDKAKRAAVAGGVLPDHQANPLPVGTSETVYAGSLVTIGLKVVNQTPRLNADALVADLEKAGVAPALLRKLVRRHTETFAGAHVFTATLVGSG